MAASTRLTPQQRVLRARLGGHMRARNKGAAARAAARTRLELAVSRSRDHAAELEAAAQAAERELAALTDDGVA
jgi:hypothetical protein